MPAQNRLLKIDNKVLNRFRRLYKRGDYVRIAKHHFIENKERHWKTLLPILGVQFKTGIGEPMLIKTTLRYYKKQSL